MTTLCGANALASYSLALHVGAVFIIGSLSCTGTLLPILAYRYPALKPPDNVLVAGNFFGTGVVIATAFVHMIPPAFTALTNPCLGHIVNSYGPLPMIIVMGSLLGMQLVEFFVSRRLHAAHDRSCAVKAVVAVQKQHTQGSESALSAPVTDMETAADCGGAVSDINSHKSWLTQHAPARDASVADKSQGSHQQLHHHHHHMNHQVDSEAYLRGRSIVTLLIFEMGVAFHSVIIGISLGVLGGAEFKTLLVALCFHQFFEGFDLGTAIVGIEPSSSTIFKTVLAYVTSTPIGVIVGILIRNSYDANS